MSTPQWRTALVTGASSGIGAALARRLARDGVEVVLAARRLPALEALVAEIVREGGKARALPLDVTRPDEAVAAIRRTDDAIGGLDLVVANAGMGSPLDAKTLSWEKVKTLCATNFTGSVATITAVLPRMVERGRGHLVGISSVAVFAPTPGGSAYRATKAGLTALLDNLRAELGGTPIKVTAVHPGFVRTPMADAFTVEPPVVLSAEQAAEIIATRLRRAPAQINFPLSVVSMLRLMGALPSALSHPIVRRINYGPESASAPSAPPLDTAPTARDGATRELD